MDNKSLWRDGIDEEAITGILAEALKIGHTSFWLQISKPETADPAVTPIIIGTSERPDDPDARHYIHTANGWWWIK